jgi:hypothetical protein
MSGAELLSGSRLKMHQLTTHPNLMFAFIQKPRNEFPTAGVVAGRLEGTTGKVTVIGRRYLMRQAATLVEFAQSTNDPTVAAALIEKAF